MAKNDLRFHGLETKADFTHAIKYCQGEATAYGERGNTTEEAFWYDQISKLKAEALLLGINLEE